MIGSNIIASLNDQGINDILVVDHLRNGIKMKNLMDLDIQDYLDREIFLEKIKLGYKFSSIEAVFHLGACSNTLETDGQFIMNNNYEYSKVLLHWCQAVSAQFIYASSASVYGSAESGFKEDQVSEMPLNIYAYSKYMFDQYVRCHQRELKNQVVGLRYFNVYGPREEHKTNMASTVYQFYKQIADSGVCKLFSGNDGYKNGEQMRDFIFVEDCAKVNLWFYDNREVSGIFNVGTGQARSFNDVANAVINWNIQNGNNDAKIEYIPFPSNLRGSYQTFTQANINALRNNGYSDTFTQLEVGITKYLNWLYTKHHQNTQLTLHYSQREVL